MSGAPPESSPNKARRTGASTGGCKVEVNVRVRPFIAEWDAACADVGKENRVQPGSEPNSLVLGSKGFRFHRVFDAEQSTQHIFEDTVRDKIHKVCQGFNVTMFAYGQTGSGKTHTMAGNEEAPGLIPLSMHEIFEIVRGAGQSKKYVLKASMMEIYEEKMYDLLSKRKQVLLRSSVSKGAKTLTFQGLAEHSVTSEAEAMALLDTGMKAKTIAPNYKHDGSSRSHTVFRLQIESAEVTSRLENFTSASLMLVDLAGSEAAHKNETDEGKKQGISINLSLLKLKNVVHDLVAKNMPRFRESLLTRLLEPSLSGTNTAFVSVICNIIPVAQIKRDTEHTLDFGTSASAIDLNPQQNQESVASSDLAKLQSLLDEMEKEKSAAGLEQDMMRAQLEQYEVMVKELNDSMISKETLEAAAEEQRLKDLELQDVKREKESIEELLMEQMEANLQKHDELQATLAAMAEMETSQKDAAMQLAVAKEQSETLARQHAEAQAALDEKATHAAALEHEQKQAAERISAAQGAAAALEAKLKEQDQCAKEKEEVLAAMAEERERLEADAAIKEAALQAHAAEAEEKEKALAEAAAERERLEAEAVQKEAALQRQAAEAEEKEKALAEKAAAVAQAQEAAASMERKLEDVKRERELAERQLAAQKKELEEAHARANSAQGGVAENEGAVAELRGQLANQSARLQQEQELQSVIDGILREEHAEADRKFARFEKMMNEEIEHKHEECEALRKELKNVKEELVTLKGAAASPQRRSSTDTPFSSPVHPSPPSAWELVSPHGELQAKDERIAQLTAEMDQMKAEMDGMMTGMQEVKRRALQEGREAAAQENASLQEQVRRLQEQVQSLEMLLSEMQ